MYKSQPSRLPIAFVSTSQKKDFVIQANSEVLHHLLTSTTKSFPLLSQIEMLNQ